MRRKKVLAFMLAAAMVASWTGPTIVANAEGLTQATDSATVSYQTLTAEQIALIRELFDVDYYRVNNLELPEDILDNDEALFAHFVTCGIFEGREGWKDFNPSAYASAYPELKALYGNDIFKYYEHYAKVGKDNGFNITTLEACANNNITVTSLSDEAIVITPYVYNMCKEFGVKNAGRIQGVVAAAEKAAAGEGYAVIAVPESQSSMMAGLTKVGTISVGEGDSYTTYSLYIVQGTVGYGAYDGYGSMADATLVYSTPGYEAPENLVDNIVMTVDVQLFDNAAEVSNLTSRGNTITGVPDSGIGTSAHLRKGNEIIFPTNREGTGAYEFTETIVEETTETHTGTTYIDALGTTSTVYDIGLNIVDNGDTIDVTVGISNDANNYEYVTEFEGVDVPSEEETTGEDGDGI